MNLNEQATCLPSDYRTKYSSERSAVQGGYRDKFFLSPSPKTIAKFLAAGESFGQWLKDQQLAAHSR